MDFLAIDRYLKKSLNNFRYEHTLRVVDMGMILCDKFFCCDREKIKAACYFHDAGKNLKEDVILEIILNEGYEPNEYELENIHIFHGFASMVIARDKFNVRDVEILNAIKNHVTGVENMSDIDKIVFLSDFFEMGRDFERVHKSRDAALIDLNLDKAMLLAYDSIISELLTRGRFIHENTIRARNFILRTGEGIL
ncbi:bis(5'-nucleosyl)-tetraphosphatase (symmetrical) YqeK [Candidatus Arthromitus sp. SFB-rat-Yit]|uniref:bis(5'-nucleosyl)-tetraphosphatase (symmetrical) YqeK n=1 Tax=Candidatus Arthromitus sp. SFB-rat-Yit TaxID=1041504 RepID=UPI000227A3E6|nr:bis(5'-nucleosyl)-tetraphosphatase (symmetrical) YqeK [Candidatus Arthromitus sp. SFB-rat-Yit]BAK80903.1 metal dependent phosphohydrolase [Candidatus Arthromitus sp. SFB-rat-Yit]